MTWQDRIKPAAYVAPSGRRHPFEFQDLSREVEKRTTAFEFAGIDEAYVQENGYGSREYPMRCFFSGPNHDAGATAFEAGLLESGVGRLEHPFYGTFPALPFGRIKRDDALATAANQSVVEVVFWTTLRALYPSAQGHPKNEILAQLEALDAATSQQFADLTNLANAVQQADLKSTIRGALNDISGALSDVSGVVTSVNQEFRDIQSLINQGIDVFVGQPLLLAQQVSNLIKAPGRALSGIQSRLDGYGRLIDRVFDSPQGNPGTALSSGLAIGSRRDRIINDFHTYDLLASSAVAGSVTAVLNHTFSTKPEAIGAAETILSQFDSVVTWRDQAFEDIGAAETKQLDQGGSIHALQEAVAFVVGFLVEISFTLVPERIVVTDRPRTIIDLAAQYYQDISDETLNFILDTNELSGDEVLEFPANREFKYYRAA